MFLSSSITHEKCGLGLVRRSNIPGDKTSRAIKHLDVPYANSGRLTNHHCEKLLYLESIAVKSTSFFSLYWSEPHFRPYK
jgi:hypothetical protein